MLGLALIAEGSSWLRALRQTRAEAGREKLAYAEYVRASRDPNVKMVLFEDSAALIGIAVAAVGIGLQAITGIEFWDPAASVAIGVLLVDQLARISDMASVGLEVSTAEDPEKPLPAIYLTRREREVLELLAEGAANRVIATQLTIAESTVKGHVRGLLEKLGASSRLEVVALARREGLP